ncbi:MAG: hypothetical protein P1U63_00970 [Coxiellaceae bacterium]|nr:hypothetical protein [Coxiellaceae bacterium]
MEHVHSVISNKMAHELERAVVQEDSGDLSRDTYDNVVNTFYQMRDCWEQACGDMEMAALEIRKQLKMSAEQVVLAASTIINEAERQVTAVTVDSATPAMLPYDYKGLTSLVQFLNMITCGLLARQYQLVLA